MSKFSMSVQNIRIVGIIMILMMLCIGSVAAERVESHKPVQKGIQALSVAIQSTGLETTPMTTADDLAQSLVGSGISISNAQFTGDPAYCGGTFTDNEDIIGFSSGVILGNGDIAFVVGPNVNDGIGRDLQLGGDADLDALIPGYETFDACALEFDFVPTTNVLTFDYVFTSDEYNEYANTEFNDVFGFFLNGNAITDNIALIPGTQTPVAINNVNMGNLGGDGSPIPVNPGFYRNNDINDGGPFLNTEMDGLTTVFRATALVNAGKTNHIKLAIADAGDHVLDSNVFLKGESFVPVEFTLLPLTATNNVGTMHTVTANTGYPSAGIIVTFTITDGPNAGMTGQGTTDANGVATWSYSSTLVGTDTIQASATFGIDPVLEESNLAYKTWETGSIPAPEFPTLAIPFGAMGVLLVVALYLRKH